MSEKRNRRTGFASDLFDLLLSFRRIECGRKWRRRVLKALALASEEGVHRRFAFFPLPQGVYCLYIFTSITIETMTTVSGAHKIIPKHSISP